MCETFSSLRTGFTFPALGNKMKESRAGKNNPMSRLDCSLLYSFPRQRSSLLISAGKELPSDGFVPAVTKKLERRIRYEGITAESHLETLARKKNPERIGVSKVHRILPLAANG